MAVAALGAHANEPKNYRRTVVVMESREWICAAPPLRGPVIADYAIARVRGQEIVLALFSMTYGTY
jgi:hypothetical protein